VRYTNLELVKQLFIKEVFHVCRTGDVFVEGPISSKLRELDRQALAQVVEVEVFNMFIFLIYLVALHLHQRAPSLEVQIKEAHDEIGLHFSIPFSEGIRHLHLSKDLGQPSDLRTDIFLFVLVRHEVLVEGELVVEPQLCFRQVVLLTLEVGEDEH